MFNWYNGQIRTSMKITGMKRNQVYNLVTSYCSESRDQDSLKSLYRFRLELIHYCIGGHFVYCLTRPLVELLLSSSFEDLRLSDIKVPYPVFEICPPAFYEVDGITLEGMLVQRGGGKLIESLDKKIASDSLKKVNKNKPPLDFYVSPIKDIADATICISSAGVVPDKKDMAFFYEFSKDKAYSKDQSLEDIGIRGPSIFPNKESFNYYCRHRQLFLSFMAYLSTLDKDCVPHKVHNRPAIGVKPPNLFLVGGSIKPESSVACHLRRSHFRALRDERFERNPDGSVKIIWVRGSVVNKDKAPAMPERKEEVLGVEKVEAVN